MVETFLFSTRLMLWNFRPPHSVKRNWPCQSLVTISSSHWTRIRYEHIFYFAALYISHSEVACHRVCMTWIVDTFFFSLSALHAEIFTVRHAKAAKFFCKNFETLGNKLLLMERSYINVWIFPLNLPYQKYNCIQHYRFKCTFFLLSLIC